MKQKKNRFQLSGRASVIESGSLKSSLDPKSNGRISKNQAGTERQQPNTSAGDLEGLETEESEDFESVAELADEGQDLEAEQIDSIARTPDPDQSELKPRLVPEPVKPRKFSDRSRI
jgi:hypothetical protein